MSDIGDKQLILDVPSLERFMSAYPAEMREAALWLAGYIRNRCNRNLSVLEKTLKDLGEPTTASTISKVLRGMWKTNSLGEELGSPVISQANFLRLVAKLRVEDQRHGLTHGVAFIETPTWERISKYIDTRRVPGRICKFGLIAGPTGSQKSRCLKEYADRNNHGQCIHIEAPDQASKSQLVTKIAVAYGSSPNVSTTRKQLRIRDCLNPGRTIIIDNIQRLYRDVGGDRDSGWHQPIFNWLQEVQEDSGCTIILCCTLEFHGRIAGSLAKGYFEQFEGRCGGRRNFMVLPSYADAADIKAIADRFELQYEEKDFPFLERLARSPGRIRILFQALQDAKAMSANGKPTIKHIKALSEGATKQAEADAAASESEAA